MKPKVFSFHYTLKDSKGTVLESSHGQEPISFLQGTGAIIPGLEDALKDLAKGAKKSVHVPAAQAYGEYDQSLVMPVPKSQLPKPDISVGDRFHAQSGDGHMTVVTVKEVQDEHVLMDGNHPMAGQDLNFDVEINDVREATEEEIAHGHAHGPGGHHHH